MFARDVPLLLLVLLVAPDALSTPRSTTQQRNTDALPPAYFALFELVCGLVPP